MFHKTAISEEDEAKGFTQFYRWHIDAALYDLSPPKATTLYALNVPQGPPQIVVVTRYDDGTGAELPVPLGTTCPAAANAQVISGYALVTSGINTFNILPPRLKSLAIRSRVRYAPHPYVWMAPARALPTGLGIESEGLEPPLSELPEWEEVRIKTFPMSGYSGLKNPITGALHFQVHPCSVSEIFVDAIPGSKSKEGALYPDGAHLTDLADVRGILYEMQRPGIAPDLVYPHDWPEKDLVIFHNRGVLHGVVGASASTRVLGNSRRVPRCASVPSLSSTM
ncbi:taurine catabolism dioxygenase [Gautieria morchelliformis]|nr:taurine catabolism dioxygenase [Gautieria morchelliformis]